MLVVSVALVVGLGVAVASAALTSPATLVATDTQVGNQVHLSWVGSGGTSPTYVVQFKSVSAEESAYTTATTTTTTETVVTSSTALVNGLAYVFRVKAFEGSEETSWAVSTAVTPSDLTAPVASLTVVPADPNAAGWYSVVPTYTIMATDPSGIATYEGQVNATDSPVAIADGGPVASGPAALSEGVHTLYYRVTDGAAQTSAWASCQFKIDLTGPTAIATGVDGYVADTPVKTLPSVKLEAVDVSGSGVDHIEYVSLPLGVAPGETTAWTTASGSEATVTAPAGHFDLLYRAVDVAGNVSGYDDFATWSDAIAPATSYITDPAAADGADGTWMTFPDVTLSATDNVDAPLVTVFAWDGGGLQDDATTTVPSVAGTHTLEYFSTDAAGNQEATKTATFVVDPGQPMTSGSFTPERPDGNNDYYVSTPTFSIDANASDDATIGVVYYSLVGADGPWSIYGDPIVVTAEGSRTIHHYAVDVNGRPGPVSSNSYKLDTVAPVIGTVSPLFTSSHNPTLTVSVTDATSGVEYAWYILQTELNVRVKVARIGFGDFDDTTGVLTYKPVWPLVDGQNAVAIEAYDAAGNGTGTTFQYVTVDTIAPVTISDAESAYISKAAIKLWANDSGVGVEDTHYRLDGGPIVAGTNVTTSVLGDHTLTFWSDDELGNVEVANVVTFKVSVPTKLSITSNRTYATSGQTVAFSGTISPTVPNGTHVVVQRRKAGSSTWTTLSTRNTFSGHHWSYGYKVPKSLSHGTYYFRVKYVGSSKYLASHSASRKIVIR
jgi:hypothetical protein